jgi:hypothetical protein
MYPSTLNAQRLQKANCCAGIFMLVQQQQHDPQPHYNHNSKQHPARQGYQHTATPHNLDQSMK